MDQLYFDVSYDPLHPENLVHEENTAEGSKARTVELIWMLQLLGSREMQQFVTRASQLILKVRAKDQTGGLIWQLGRGIGRDINKIMIQRNKPIMPLLSHIQCLMFDSTHNMRRILMHCFFKSLERWERDQCSKGTNAPKDRAARYTAGFQCIASSDL